MDRDVPGGLDALRGERFDAVVDVARMSYAWVRDALDALAPTAAHWTFVSTVSVYADAAALGQTDPAIDPTNVPAPGDPGAGEPPRE